MGEAAVDAGDKKASPLRVALDRLVADGVINRQQAKAVREAVKEARQQAGGASSS